MVSLPVIIAVTTIGFLGILGWTIAHGQFLATFVITMLATILLAGLYVPYRKKHDKRGPGNQNMHGD